MSSFQEVLDLQRQLEEKKQGVIQGLLKQQDEINKQLSELGYGQTVQAKGRRVCSNCGKPGHNAKTCTEPKKHANSHKKEHN